MRKTATDEIFLKAYDCRVNIINDIAKIRNGQFQKPILDNIQANIDNIIELLGGNRTREFYLIFKSLFIACQYLLQWEEAIKNATENANRFHEAYKYHIKEALKQTKEVENNKELLDIVCSMENITTTDDINRALGNLSELSLPLPIHWEEDPKVRKEYPSREDMFKEKKPDVVAFLVFKINEGNIQEPHFINPNTLYDLNLEVRLNRWPENSNKLVIQPLSDIQADNYQMPTFEISKDGNSRTYQVSGRMAIKLEQTFESQPLEFVYQVYSLPKENVISVTGNNRIRIRSDSEGKLVISGYGEADKALMAIRSAIAKEPGVTFEQRINFLLIMKHLANIAGQALASNEFPGVWDEKQFQQEIRKRLRLAPDIGSNLLDHPNVAGGITDLFFKKLQIELKVEVKKIVTLENANTFLQQGSQYTAGSDNRLGIICILDCSEKKIASGSLVNDIGLITIPVPGILKGGFPLLLGVVIIRGNLGRPSSL